MKSMEESVSVQKDNVINEDIEIEKLYELIELYKENYYIEYYSYRMMGKLLDNELVKERVELLEIKELYIYGGGYLGLQLYRAIKDYVVVKGIIDTNGNVSNSEDNVNVIILDKLEDVYNGEKIIVTPIRYYSEIKEQLNGIVSEQNIIYLGEFIEGRYM